MAHIPHAVRALYRRINPRAHWESSLHGLSRLTGWPEFHSYCPVCERPLRSWRANRRDVGAGQLRDEGTGRICPLCYSFERTRLFCLYLEQHRLLHPGLRFLHFAPEDGLERRLRARLGGSYRTTDLFMAGVDYREDITRMSLPDASFDFIYCSNVLEHVPADTSAMNELFRILAPGGRLVVQVPIKGDCTYENPAIILPAERALHFGQADHVRYYGRDIRSRLESAGFRVEECYLQDRLTLAPEAVVRFNVAARELLHLCTKPGPDGTVRPWPGGRGA